MSKSVWVFYLALVLIGATWGLTFPITKVVVSTGYQPYGILVWQLVSAIILTGAFTLWRRKTLRFSRRHFPLYFGVAMLGSVVSGYFSYTAAPHLPGGVLAIIIALVPLFSMPVALLMGFEKPSLYRLSGLFFGAGAVVLLVGPETSLPTPGTEIFVIVAMLSTLAYGIEGNFLEWFNARATDPVPDPFQVLFGASIFGLCVALPLALVSGQYIDPFIEWSAPEWGILLISVLSTFAYSGYIWLIGRTGPVFAAQVSYLVTSFGVGWSMMLLGESYSSWVWLALILILAGLFLVQPRQRESSLDEKAGVSEDAN